MKKIFLGLMVLGAFMSFSNFAMASLVTTQNSYVHTQNADGKCASGKCGDDNSTMKCGSGKCGGK